MPKHSPPQLVLFYCILSFYSALFCIYVRCTRVSHFAKLKANMYIHEETRNSKPMVNMVSEGLPLVDCFAIRVN
jgi:hypothetical protein